MGSARTRTVGLIAFLSCGSVLAQNKDVQQIGVRLGPPNFAPQVTGDSCTNPNVAIGDNNPAGVSSSIVIADGSTINNDFEIGLEITHTWVGDLRATITHVDTATTVIAMDRPGFPSSPFGCSRDDVDATLSLAGNSPVETTCLNAVPTISGTLTPNNPLSAFNGQNITGTWTLNVSDNASGDVGTLDVWCVNQPIATGGGDPGGPATTGGTGTPATETWGVVFLIAVFLGISAYQLRRRRNV